MEKKEVQNDGKKGFRNLIAVVNNLPLESLLKNAEDLLKHFEENVASEQSGSNKINKLADSQSPEKSGKKTDKGNNEQENGSAMASILKLVIKLLKMIIASRPVVNSLYGTDIATNGSVSSASIPSETTPRDNAMSEQDSEQDALKKTLAQFDPDEFKILFDHLVDVAVEDGELTPEETTELLNVGIQGGLGTEDDICAIVGKKLILHSIQAKKNK